MTLAQQILHLWRQGHDTYEIGWRLEMHEAVVHRVIIDERARLLPRPWATGGAA